jgi:alpha-mannosidase
MEFNQGCEVLEDWPDISQDPHLEPSCSLLFWQSKNLIPLALKLAQNGKDWILRVYEAQGEQSNLELEGAANLKIDQSCDLLEKPIDGSSLVKPYQIASYSVISQSS